MDIRIKAAAALLGSILHVPVSAAQELSYANLLICDTLEQISEVIKLPFTTLGEIDSAIATINERAGDGVCMVGLIVFAMDTPYGKVRISDHPYEMARILVYGIKFGTLMTQMQVPFPQYTLLPIVEIPT